MVTRGQREVVARSVKIWREEESETAPAVKRKAPPGSGIFQCIYLFRA